MNHRLFLAIPLPSDTIFSILEIQKAVLKVDRNISAVPADQLFIKLHYLGNVPEKQYNLLAPMLQDLIKKYQSFSVDIAFLETRYNRHEKSQVLLNLKIDESFKYISIFLDKHQLFQPKRIIPELNIAYVAKQDPTQVKKVLSDIDSIDVGNVSKIVVDKLVLVEELWSKKGVYLRVVSQFPLC